MVEDIKNNYRNEDGSFVLSKSNLKNRILESAVKEVGLIGIDDINFSVEKNKDVTQLINIFIN